MKENPENNFDGHIESQRKKLEKLGYAVTPLGTIAKEQTSKELGAIIDVIGSLRSVAEDGELKPEVAKVVAEYNRLLSASEREQEEFLARYKGVAVLPGEGQGIHLGAFAPEEGLMFRASNIGTACVIQVSENHLLVPRFNIEINKPTIMAPFGIQRKSSGRIVSRLIKPGTCRRAGENLWELIEKGELES